MIRTFLSTLESTGWRTLAPWKKEGSVVKYFRALSPCRDVSEGKVASFSSLST